MKKIFLGLMALTIMSTTAVYASGGKKKAKAKAKTTQCCPGTNCTKGKSCPMPCCKQ